ncbi:hypothetical protein C2S52_016579 [Perilla frutescens var. hirtella]|nr:hypothetical protein C2S52_016579 [Perilla frutescens var. hirtella]
MAALYADGSTSLPGDGEAPPPTTEDRRRGGSITTPFIIATMCGLTLASTGSLNNLIVFLIKNFNIKRIDAAQINNVVNGCVNFFPLVAALLADSLLGCFSLIWISSLISLLGHILLVLTVTVDSLRPPACDYSGSNSCPTPSMTQYAVLYSALALVSIGVGGTRFTLATMGANQLTKLSQQSSYFDRYFFSFYSASFIGATGIVYIEDNLSWGRGFLICIAANVLGLVLFLIGSGYYTRDKPRASPLVSLFRVVVASVRKRNASISSEIADYYYGDDGVVISEAPTKRFRQLNRAALKTEGDILSNGSIASPWKLCSVEQVEDLKSLIRILPLWSSSIFLGTPIGVQISLTVVQTLATNRHLSRTFEFPAATILVFSLISTAIGVAFIDHCFRPLWKITAGENPITPLQQIGIGHVFNIASMAVSALVESRRRSSAVSGHLMSVVWLVPQMVVVGIGEAFHFPGQVGLYYQKFPTCLKSLSTAMVAMLIGVAFYLSTAVLAFIRRITDWLPDDINNGRVDYVYWVMVVIGIINFAYFILISWSYQYKNGEVVNKDQIVSGDEECMRQN